MPLLISLGIVFVIAAVAYIVAGPVIGYLIIGKSMAKIGGSAPAPVRINDYSLFGSYDGKTVAARTHDGFAGAIWSLQWGGREFLLVGGEPNSGHGGQMQTAYQADGLMGAWNPTEAGSQKDGTGPTSSTQILSISSDGTTLRTSIHPAFWRPYNGRVVTDDILSKTVTLKDNIIKHDISITFAQAHQWVLIEGLCAYLASDIRTWTAFDPVAKTFTSVDTPPMPPLMPNSAPDWTPDMAKSIPTSTITMIASTADGTCAIAGYCKDTNGTYLYGWGAPNWPKWDTAYVQIPSVDAGHVENWTCYTVFGTLEQVKQTLLQLAA